MKRKAIMLASIFLIFILALFIPIKIACAELDQITITTHPKDDSYISHGEPDTNYGQLEKIRLRNDYGYAGSLGWGWDALIKFDISNLIPGSTVLSATLKTYYDEEYYYNQTNQTLNLYMIKSPWDEETVTWNNQPTFSSEKTSITIIPLETSSWVEWNVTSDVQKYFKGTENNYGWRITDENQWEHFDIPEFILNSKESDNIDKWPILEIELTNEKPEVNFSYNFSTYDRKVNFTDKSTDSYNNIYSWKWDFGDGSISYQQNPTHYYKKCGTYPINLTVKDDIGTRNYSLKNIEIPIIERVKIEIEKQFNITLNQDFYINGINQLIDPNDVIYTVRAINSDEETSFIVSINNSMDKLFFWDSTEDNITKLNYSLAKITDFVNDSNNSYYIVNIKVNSSNPAYVKITDYFTNVSKLVIKREDGTYIADRYIFRENNFIYFFDTAGSEYELIYGNKPNKNLILNDTSNNKNDILIYFFTITILSIVLFLLIIFKIGYKRRKIISSYVTKGNIELRQIDQLINSVKQK